MNEWILDVDGRALQSRCIYRISPLDTPNKTWEVVAQLPDHQSSILVEGLPDRESAIDWIIRLVGLDLPT